MQAKIIRYLPLGVSMTLHCLFHLLVSLPPVPANPLAEYLTQFRPIYETLIPGNLGNVFVLLKTIDKPLHKCNPPKKNLPLQLCPDRSLSDPP